MGSSCSKRTETDTPNSGPNNATMLRQGTRMLEMKDQSEEEEESEKQEEKTIGQSVLQSLDADFRSGEILGEVPLFKKLTELERAKVGSQMEEEVFQPGETIFRINDDADKFYIIIQGDVEVIVREEGQEELVVATLTARDYFGEGAMGSELADGSAKRNATIRTKNEVAVLTLTRKQFLQLFSTKVLNVKVARRRVGVTAGLQDEQEPATLVGNDVPKSDAVKMVIKNAIVSSHLFSSFTEEESNQIVENFLQSTIKKDTLVCRQGHHERHLYVIETGEFGVFCKREDDPVDEKLPHGKSVAVMKEGSLFGELSLMFAQPRAATVVANEDSVVWMLDRFTFQRMKKNVKEDHMEMHTKFLSEINLLSPLTSSERFKIAEAVDEVVFPADHIIFNQGDEGDAMYIVRTGTVKIFKDDKYVSSLTAGGYFGELALTTGEKRAARVVCESGCEVLKLDAVSFKLLMGPLTDILESRKEDYNEENGPKDAEPVEKNHAVEMSEALKHLSNSDLKVHGLLGQGAFGTVKLIQIKSEIAEDGEKAQFYAMKSVTKQRVVETHQEKQIVNEKNVMLQLKHPMIVELFTTFKDQNRLHFVMEPVLGGDLYGVLQKETMFTTTSSRFYAGCVILAFEYLHSLDYIYRDLKPENLMLDASGYIKVIDFGFVKKVRSNQITFTLCGTSEYLCPEIVKAEGHNRGCDWWTVGILLYEMLCGQSPFYHHSEMTMFKNISAGLFKLPPAMNPTCKNLLTGLLTVKPTKRLGITKGGAQTIKDHPWFTSIDFKNLEKRLYKAPFIPADTSKPENAMANFGTVTLFEEESKDEYKEDGRNWDASF